MVKKKKVFDIYSIILPAILVFLFLSMLVWSWRKWPDILIDFGRELYLPWRISSGEMLYRDIAHFFGPFSSYFNALVFKIFGTSYLTLIITNVLILVLFLSMLYVVLLRVTSRMAAFMSCFVVVAVFSFSQYTLVGNYNFISPYSHEAIHGVMLSLLLIYLLYHFYATSSKCCLLFAGVILGLVFLTKTEVFLAAFITVIFFFLIFFCKNRNLNLKLIGLFIMAVILPIISFALYFATAMPLSEAFMAILNPFKAVLNVSVVSTSFYFKNMGLDNIVTNIFKTVSISIATISLIIVALLSSYFLPKCKKKPEVKGLCIIGIAVCFAITLFYTNPYNVGIPLLMLDIVVFFIIFIIYLKFSKTDKKNAERLVLLLLLSVFSVFLLLKIVFNCRIFHYGFYLSLPSVVLMVVMLVYFLPEWLKRKSGGYNTVFRNVMILIIVIIVGKFVLLSNRIYRMKTFSVGYSYDKIITNVPKDEYFRGYLIDQALDWLSLNVDKNETFAVLPEGVMLNYLTKRENPTKYTNFMLPELLTYGENNILKEFMIHSPDYIVLVHRLPSYEYGVGYFGKNSNYGNKIMSWIYKNYKTCLLLGNEPFKSKKFGIKILKRV